MPDGLVEWLAFWAAFGFLDYHAEPTLCDTVRRTFRTDTPVGGAVFTATFVGGAYVLHRHIKGRKKCPPSLPPL